MASDNHIFLNKIKTKAWYQALQYAIGNGWRARHLDLDEVTSDVIATPKEGRRLFSDFDDDGNLYQIDTDGNIVPLGAVHSHDASDMSFTPTGSISSTDVQSAVAELGAEDAAVHIADTTDAHDASSIGFTPNGSIAATNVQLAIQEVRDEGGGGGGAPTTADYLVGTTDGGLSNEIVVGPTPGGELGGTWASPNVDITHSGSSHTGVVATHAGLADPHTGYRLESADHSHASTGLQAGQIAGSDLSGIPGGELGNTWAAPTVDTTHSGTSHAGVISTHEGLADPHTGYRLESADHTHASTGLQAGQVAANVVTFTPNGSIAATDVQAAIQEVRDEAAGGGAPSTSDFLVGTADGGLSNEIVVGLTPGGELGGTWASPTVDLSHSGTSHTGVVATHAGLADPHTGYVLESLVDAGGDLIVGTADNVVARLPVGAALQVLRVNAGATGLEYAAAGGGAPSTSDYLVGTTDGGLSNEIVVGTTPGGELGGTWASPTVDTTHAGGTSHAGVISTHEAAGDPHIGYRLESENHTHASSGLQAGTIAYSSLTGTPTIPADNSAATYLTTTAQAGLSAEVVVGATPGGELGGTWASPTVDTVHAGGRAHTASTYTSASNNNIGSTKTIILASVVFTPAIGDVINIKATGACANPNGSPSTPTYDWYVDWNPTVGATTQISHKSVSTNRPEPQPSMQWSCDITVVVTAATTTKTIVSIPSNLRDDGSVGTVFDTTTAISNFSGETGTIDFAVRGQNNNEDISVDHVVITKLN